MREIEMIKAMRRRIALQKHCVRNLWETPVLFRGAFGVRTRTIAMLYEYRRLLNWLASSAKPRKQHQWTATQRAFPLVAARGRESRRWAIARGAVHEMAMRRVSPM